MSENKKLAVNTIMLYFRMMLTMGVSLYTVRVVLNTLGVVDYGIYNVVGGVVTSFSFLSSTMASATQRFFSFEIGKKDYIKLNKVFSLSLTIYFGLAVVILILAETIGLWFLNVKLFLPSDRVTAANWVYQFSILSFMMTMIRIPYDAAIIARERMSMYAYVSIFEVILKLGVVFFLVIVSFDKLVLYSILIFFISTIITIIYKYYCTKEFLECKFHYYFEKSMFRTLLSYSGWNLFGTLTTISFDQGLNFLLNVFFGPVVNAARGITYQVNTAVSSFSSNFYTAVRPQIIKSYANGDTDYMMSLVLKSSKYSYFLLLLISMPILLEPNFILKFWLKEPPLHSVSFVQLTILFSLLNSLQIPLTTAVQATGDIKKYQIVIGCIMLLTLPFSFILLKLNYTPESSYLVMILLSLIALYFRLSILKSLINFEISTYMKEVIFKIFLVSILIGIIPLIIRTKLDEGILRFFIVCISCFISSLIVIYTVGLEYVEQKYLLNIFKIKFLSKL